MAQDEERSSLRVADLGLTILYQPGDEQSITADLVFVHGLQGHPWRTWESSVTSTSKTSGRNPFKRWSVRRNDKEGPGVFWPADLIPQDFPQLRVLTYGYDSKRTGYYASSTSKNGIFDHGNSLLNALSQMRTNLAVRPIIFVAHSLGGLVVKQALVEARKRTSSSHIHDIYTSARAVIFFGTPHRGSDSASWGLMANKLAKAAQMDVNDAVLRELDPASGNTKLLELRRDFHDVLQDSGQRSPLQLYTFQEELGMTSLRALGGKVVTDESSSFDSPDYGYDNIHANHMNMCRFTGITDDGYRKFRAVLNGYVQQLVHKPAVDEQAEGQAQQESLDGLMRNLDFAERRSRENQLRNLDTVQSSFGWIWDSVFADWLSSPNPLFWLRGKPASGKSTLTQYLVGNDRTYSKLREYKDCEWLTICFFFDFRGGKGMNNNFEGLLRSLLVQLLDAMPGLNKYALSESSTHWHEARLRRCLRSVFDHSSKGLCLFIDGLDEYEGNMLQLLWFLRSLQTVGENSGAPRKIYVSSRPEPVPSEVLQGTPSLSLSEENGPGIRAYIQSVMTEMFSDIAEDPHWGPVCDDLVKKADGVFLWIRFALDEGLEGFCKGDNVSELSDRLQRVPDELEGIYKRIIDRMEPLAKDEAFLMLRIACSTSVDLFLQDFLVALAFTMETDLSIRRSIGCSELQRFSRRVRDKVGGLLEIIEVKDDCDRLWHDSDEDNSEEGNGSEDKMENAQDDFNEDISADGAEAREEPLPKFQVKLTHKTVDTFLDKTGWQLLQPEEQLLPLYGDLLLLVTCSKYLEKILHSFDLHDEESPVTRYVIMNANAEPLYPFFAYSACALLYHARLFETLGNRSSYAYTEKVLCRHFGPVHIALVNNNPHYSTCLCSFPFLAEKFSYDPTSAFAHGLPKRCEELICKYGGQKGFPIDEALNEAILYSSRPCHLNEAIVFESRPCDPTAYLLYNLDTISLVLSKVTQIKQCHLERAMAIPAPVEVLRLLLGHQSFENLKIFRNDGEEATLLWLLISSKVVLTDTIYLDLVLKLLIEKGDDVNEPCGPDGTALDYVVNLELDDAQTDLAKALVSCGARKTMNPLSLSKLIYCPNAGTIKEPCITLGYYLELYDEYNQHRGRTQGSRESGADLLSNIVGFED